MAEKPNTDVISCKKNMTEIYTLIGQLVEATQMIEGMFQGINFFKNLLMPGMMKKLKL